MFKKILRMLYENFENNYTSIENLFTKLMMSMNSIILTILTPTFSNLIILIEKFRPWSPIFHMIKYWASPSRAATLAILQLCPVANTLIAKYAKTFAKCKIKSVWQSISCHFFHISRPFFWHFTFCTILCQDWHKHKKLRFL